MLLIVIYIFIVSALFYLVLSFVILIIALLLVFRKGCNLWRIFIVNDEHTDRKYLHFFVIGWGRSELLFSSMTFLFLSVIKYLT